MPRAVWALGFVSLLTDAGSEMVHSVLPILLVSSFGASAVLIGLIEGTAEALVLVTKVFSGYLSDAMGRRKPLVVAGYGLAAVAKLLFPLAGSIGMIATARFVDRFGKGIRGAPRDALVGDLTPPEIRGAAFGLRQSLDTVGAVIGPLIAIALLWAFAENLQIVLWVAVLPGILAVALLLRAVQEPPRMGAKPARLPISRAGLRSLGPRFHRLVALGALISLARFSEAFLILRATDLGVSLTAVPLVLIVMSVVYAMTAWPAGWLADRMPKTRLLAVGMAVLIVADVLLAAAVDWPMLFVGIGLWGLHMGLTQGILASLVADVSEPAWRGTAFGVFNLVSGLALLAASLIAGGLWEFAGPSATFIAGAAFAAAAWAGIGLTMRRSPIQ